MNVLGISETELYKQTSQRDHWRTTYHKALADQCSQQQLRSSQPQSQVLCEGCGRTFRRAGDKARHKCIDECQKPIHEQRGAVQCSNCSRWFQSQGVCQCIDVKPQKPETYILFVIYNFYFAPRKWGCVAVSATRKKEVRKVCVTMSHIAAWKIQVYTSHSNKSYGICCLVGPGS